MRRKESLNHRREMKNTIRRLDKRLHDFHRTRALQEWIPGVFDGDHAVTTQITEKASNDLPQAGAGHLTKRERYKSMTVHTASGEVIKFPIEEVPDELL